MSLFNFFTKNNPPIKKQREDTYWSRLPIPNVEASTVRHIPLGGYTLEKLLGEVQQARPPRRAQIWQAKNQSGEICFLGLIEPGAENKEWLEKRLGFIQVQKWFLIKTQGTLRKLGDKLDVLVFDTILSERYLLKSSIVSDAMQETYIAYDLQENRYVYCVLYLPNAGNLPSQFFKRPSISKIAEKCIQNKYPNQILELLDEGMTRPVGMFAPYRFKVTALYYCIVRYVPGVSFSHFAKAWRGNVSADAVGRILTELGICFNYLEREKSMHGNLRPQTIFIGTEGDDKGRIFLNGYSIQSPEDQNSSAQQMLQNSATKGYPFYLAPEQLSYKNVDVRADYFSLGVILYELITARRLFRSQSQREMFTRLERWKVPTSLRLPASFSWIEPFLMDLLQPNPNNRTIDWDSFLQELKESYNDWSVKNIQEDSEFIIESPKQEVKQEIKQEPEQKIQQAPKQESKQEPQPKVQQEMEDISDEWEDLEEEPVPTPENSENEWEEISEPTESTENKSFLGNLFSSLASKAEQRRIEQEIRAEQERIEREQKAEQERIEREQRAEQERIEQEIRAEQERIEREQKAEQERIEHENQLKEIQRKQKEQHEKEVRALEELEQELQKDNIRRQNKQKEIEALIVEDELEDDIIEKNLDSDIIGEDSLIVTPKKAKHSAIFPEDSDDDEDILATITRTQQTKIKNVSKTQKSLEKFVQEDMSYNLISEARQEIQESIIPSAIPVQSSNQKNVQIQEENDVVILPTPQNNPTCQEETEESLIVTQNPEEDNWEEEEAWEEVKTSDNSEKKSNAPVPAYQIRSNTVSPEEMCQKFEQFVTTPQPIPACTDHLPTVPYDMAEEQIKQQIQAYPEPNGFEEDNSFEWDKEFESVKKSLKQWEK